MSTPTDPLRTKQGHLEAFRATGSSPTPLAGRPTVHLLGPGGVGRALLEQFPEGATLVAVTDTEGTLVGPGGLDPGFVVAAKEAGSSLKRALGSPPGAEPRGGGPEADGEPAGGSHFIEARPISQVLPKIAADVVIDATSTSFDRPEWADALESSVLDRGKVLILAAKDAVASRGACWAREYPRQLGINAVLGGTGHLLLEELEGLRASWSDVALSGNASTTAILTVIEGGGSLERGIEEAGALGLLETDPRLDLEGTDAAVKVAIVAGLLLGRPVGVEAVGTSNIRELDVDRVRATALDGGTTRLVGRIRRNGDCFIGYESLEPGSPLAVPVDRVAYVYERDDGDRRVHVGGGLGAHATAEAALVDFERFTGAQS